MSDYIKLNKKHNPNPEEVDRNRNLVLDRDSGMSWSQLSEKYKRTPQRCAQIYKQYAPKYSLKSQKADTGIEK
jgi:hypothetical protein